MRAKFSRTPQKSDLSSADSNNCSWGDDLNSQNKSVTQMTYLIWSKHLVRERVMTTPWYRKCVSTKISLQKHSEIIHQVIMILPPKRHNLILIQNNHTLLFFSFFFVFLFFYFIPNKVYFKKRDLMGFFSIQILGQGKAIW